jgi:hypothetical protein
LIPAFYEFFEIPEDLQPEERHHRISEISFRPTEPMDLRASTIGMSSPINPNSLNNKLTSGWTDYRREEIGKYCSFFRVQLTNCMFNKEENHYIFCFRVEGALNAQINYDIDKRYSDFVTLAEMMKAVSKARPPPLPQKLMMVKDDKKIEVRGAQLCQWL